MRYRRERSGLGLLSLVVFLSQGVSAAERPVIEGLQLENGQLTIRVDVPDGYGHVLVESGSDLRDELLHPLVSGEIFGYAGTATI